MMTKIIGLTGGIGSGKSTVAKIFMEMNVPVYIADDAGRAVMKDPSVVDEIRKVFTDEVFEDGKINTKSLSKIVFNNPERLQHLNSIVHPAVAAHFKNWLSKHQNSPFVIKEAAILFESGTNYNCDAVISVVAPEEIRIERVIARDSVQKEDVQARINNQWTDEQRIEKSDFVIYNSTFEKLKSQTLAIYYKLQGN